MPASSSAEHALTALMNTIEDGLGDSFRMTNRLLEGARFYGEKNATSRAELVLEFEVVPVAELDDDGQAVKPFDEMAVTLELRECGMSEGDQVRVTLPRDWNLPIANQTRIALQEWFERNGDIVGVTLDNE